MRVTHPVLVRSFLNITELKDTSSTKTQLECFLSISFLAIKRPRVIFTILGIPTV